MSIPRADRILGCLLGGAIGDALGEPVEFMTMAAIIMERGPGGVQGFPYEDGVGGVNHISDDTQLTLFTIEGLLDALQYLPSSPLTRFDMIDQEVHCAYLRWYDTQTFKKRPTNDARATGLQAVNALWHRRAPGVTCLSSLSRVERPGRAPKVVNNSKGNGAVMRTAPVGMFAPRIGDDETVFECGSRLAYLTHQHPSGWIAAGFQSVLVAALMRGEARKTAINSALKAMNACVGYLDSKEVEKAVCRAMIPGIAVNKLGEGWVAEEALAIGVNCLLNVETYHAGVLRAVNHGGDSDTTGAIAGNLLGAYWGVNDIPASWRINVELRGIIGSMAGQVAEATDPRRSSSSR